MTYSINLRSPIARTNGVTDELIRQRPATGNGYVRDFTYEPGLVLDGGGGYELPDADAYARRMADAAEAWLAHARTRARMKEATVVSKALHSLAFSLRHRANDLAVPSKLSGTAKHQPALWRLTRERVGFGTPLDVAEVHESGSKRVCLVVRYEGDALGEVQPKHVPWLRPLLRFGAGLFLTRVTGHEGSYTLGCNVAFGRVGSAVAALNHALGADLGPDLRSGLGTGPGSGTGGDGYGGSVPASGGDGVSSDGAAGRLQLVSSAPSVAKPRVDTTTEPDAHPEPDPDDVVLCRALDGTARAVRRGRPLPHAVRHSPTGFEWGYGGSGPADLARSILLQFADEATVERLYQAFKAEVVAAVPQAGGVICASDVRAWLASKSAGTR